MIDLPSVRALCDGASSADRGWRVTSDPTLAAGVGDSECNSLLMIDVDGMACFDKRGDAQFWVGARTLLPAALSEIESLRKALGEACDLGTHFAGLECSSSGEDRFAELRKLVGA